MDKLEFLDGAEAPVEDVHVAEAPKEEAQPQPEAAEAEPKAEQPRNDRGQFAPKATEEAPQPEEPAPAAPEPKTDQIMVPLAALHETRDKVKTLEAQLAQLQPRQQPQQPVEIPDPDLDPVGFAQYQSHQFEAQRYQDRLFFSERLAVMQHGQDTFDKAREWGLKKCDEDPHFNARVRSSQDPYSVVLAEYQRDQIASQVSPDDFAAFQAWRAAQGQLQAQQQQAAPAAPQQLVIPPRSIASAPSAGGGAGHIPTGPGQAFDNAFK